MAVRLVELWVYQRLKNDAFAKTRISRLYVIPAKVGIQELQQLIKGVDTRFRGYGDFLGFVKNEKKFS